MPIRINATMHYLVWKYSVFITRINDDKEVAAIQYNAIDFGMTIDPSIRKRYNANIMTRFSKAIDLNVIKSALSLLLHQIQLFYFEIRFHKICN